MKLKYFWFESPQDEFKQEQEDNFTVGNMQPMLNRLKGLGLSDFFVILFFLYS